MLFLRALPEKLLRCKPPSYHLFLGKSNLRYQKTQGYKRVYPKSERSNTAMFKEWAKEKGTKYIEREKNIEVKKKK